MEKGNVLVIGNSGVGKSTLIDVVLADDEAFYDMYDKSIICESANVPFRLIDAVSLEEGFVRSLKAIHDIKKTKNEIKKWGEENNKINIIWFCLDASAKHTFEKSIDSFEKVIADFKSVPIIVLLMKSDEISEWKENISFTNNILSMRNKIYQNVKRIIPIIANVNEPDKNHEGIEALVNLTNEIMPETMRASQEILEQLELKRRRRMAQGKIVFSAMSALTAVAAGKGGARVLNQIELAEIKSIAKVYDIKEDENFKSILDKIVSMGFVKKIAEVIIDAINKYGNGKLKERVLNAVIAGSIVSAIGIIAICIFEQIYLGNKSTDNIDWVTDLVDDNILKGFAQKTEEIINQANDDCSDKELAKNIVGSFITIRK